MTHKPTSTPWCPTCGRDNDTPDDCPKCKQWWIDNPLPIEDMTPAQIDNLPTELRHAVMAIIADNAPQR